MAKVKKAAKGVLKKKWVVITAPKLFNEEVMGETNVYDAREGIGKNITVNLMQLTNNPKMQGINVRFVVTGQHEDRLITELVSYRMMPSFVRRMGRRGRSKIEDSFTCTTSDGKVLRVKPIVLTRSEANGTILASLRKKIRDFVVSTVSKTNYDDLCFDIISHKLQKGIHDAVNKTYPLATCEIRWFFIIPKAASAAKKEEPKEAPAAEA